MQSYISKGIRISQSRDDDSRFIFEFTDGTFFAVNSTAALIEVHHPRDTNQNFPREYKEFPHSSNYKPQAVGFQSFAKLARSHSKQSKS